jgi:transposase
VKGKPEKARGVERSRRTFSTEFKAEAVQLMRRRRALGVSLAQIGRELDVAPTLLWEWAQRLDGRGTGGGTERSDDGPGEETLEEEVRRLRREVVVLRQEREFAKKAAAFFAKESQ